MENKNEKKLITKENMKDVARITTGGAIGYGVYKIIPLTINFTKVGVSKLVALSSIQIQFLGVSALMFYSFWIITLLLLMYSGVREAQVKMAKRRS